MNLERLKVTFIKALATQDVKNYGRTHKMMNEEEKAVLKKGLEYLKKLQKGPWQGKNPARKGRVKDYLEAYNPPNVKGSDAAKLKVVIRDGIRNELVEAWKTARAIDERAQNAQKWTFESMLLPSNFFVFF